MPWRNGGGVFVEEIQGYIEAAWVEDGETERLEDYADDIPY
jgi:hypothetical protein